MAQIPKWLISNSQDFLSGNVTATDVEKLKKKELILVAKELLAYTEL